MSVKMGKQHHHSTAYLLARLLRTVYVADKSDMMLQLFDSCNI